MNPRRTWVVVFLFFLTAINYADRIVLSIAVGPISHEFGFSPVQIGYLLSSFLWAYTLALIPVGYLVDRIPAKGLCGWAIALWSAATMATGLGGGMITLISMRLIMGIGESSSTPVAAKVIREWFPPRERGLANGAMISGGLGGSALASLLIGGLMTVLGWRATFLCVGAIGLIWLAAWWRWFDAPERVRWLKPQERQLILEQRTPVVSADSHPAASFGSLLLSRSLWALAFTQGCGVYVLYLFLTWSPSYLQSVKHMSLARSGVVSAIPYLVACIGGILIGRLSDRAGADEGAHSTRRRRYVVISMLASSVVLLTPLFETPWAFIVFTSIALTGVSASFAQIYALVNDLLHERAHVGKCIAVVTIGGNIFGMLAPIVTGYVVQSTHRFDSAYVVAGTLLCLGAAVCYGFARRPILPRTETSPGEVDRDRVPRPVR